MKPNLKHLLIICILMTVTVWASGNETESEKESIIVIRKSDTPDLFSKEIEEELEIIRQLPKSDQKKYIKEKLKLYHKEAQKLDLPIDSILDSASKKLTITQYNEYEKSEYGFWTGLVAFLTIPTFFLPLPLGILGIIYSLRDIKRSRKKAKANIGLILSSIASVVGALLYTFFIVALIIFLILF